MSETDRTAGGPPAEPRAPQPSEEEAWAAVRAAWEDEAVHRAYLARFTDIEGLAVAGGRYRAVLDERRDDPVALRMRAEVVKKATAYGMAALPRERPAPSRTLKRVLVVAALAFGYLAAWGLYKLALLARAWF